MVFDRIRTILVDILGVEPDDVTPNASFIDDLGADSLDLVELIMAFEREFNVEVSDDEAERWLTVSDAWRAAERMIGEGA